MSKIGAHYISMLEGYDAQTQTREKKKVYPLHVKSGVDVLDKTSIKRIKNTLGVSKVVQINRMQFIEEVFQELEYYICLFLRKFNKDGTEMARNVFFGKNEYKGRLDPYLEKNKRFDTYISYSSFVSKKKKYELTAETIRIKDKKTGEVIPFIDYIDGYLVTVKELKRKAKPLRTQPNIRRTHALVQDLDIYKDKISITQALNKIRELIETEQLPIPNIFLFTGRGLQLVWIINPIPMIKGSKTDQYWSSVQQHFYDVLKIAGLHPDVVVKNPSAVTRVEGTKNQKNGEEVKAFMLRDDIWSIERYVEYLGLIPVPDLEVIPEKKKTSKSSKPKKNVSRMVANWNEFTLNRQHELDIFIYAQYCIEKGIDLEGKRNKLALILWFYALVSTHGDYKYAEEQVDRLIELFEDHHVMNHTSFDEIKRRAKTAIRYYREWIGEIPWENPNGKYKTAGLFYTNETLVKDVFHCYGDYEAQRRMKSIKWFADDDEKRAYDAYRKRVERYGEEHANERTREAYLQAEANKTESKLEQLREILAENPKVTNKDLAELLGVHRNTISNWKKQL